MRLREDQVVRLKRITRRMGKSEVLRSSSLVVFTKAGEVATLSVPDHREVARGTLRSLIRAADLSVDEFLAAV